MSRFITTQLVCPRCSNACVILAKRNSQDKFEFIFVDDGSKDNSFAVLSELHTTEPRMRVIKHARNFGSNAAIRAGLKPRRRRGGGDMLLTCKIHRN